MFRTTARDSSCFSKRAAGRPGNARIHGEGSWQESVPPLVRRHNGCPYSCGAYPSVTEPGVRRASRAPRERARFRWRVKKTDQLADGVMAVLGVAER
jgi:hypothetical protein